MGLAEINHALLQQLELVEGLRSFAWVPDTVSPPAAVIQPPRTRTNNHNEALRRVDGVVVMWRWRIPVTLVFGRVGERDWAAQYDRFTQELERVLPRSPVCHAHILQIDQARQISIGGADYMASDVVVEAWQ